jgi:hypothetical protein
VKRLAFIARPRAATSSLSGMFQRPALPAGTQIGRPCWSVRE